nr:hypothetical protein [Tanacetum cinerariifolium]
MKDEPCCCLYLNVDKTEVFLPKEDLRSRLAGVFPPNSVRPLHCAKLLGEPASVDFNFSSELVMKRVAKTIMLMDTISKVNDPRCELLFLRACAGNVLNYAFLTSRLQFASLRTKLLRHYGIVSFGPAFNDTLCAFNTKMETGLLSNASDITTPKLMKKLTDIYLTRVTQTAEFTFSLSSQQMALWKSQMEDHTSDWLRVFPIFGLGQTMNACSKVFTENIYGDHVISCVGIICDTRDQTSALMLCDKVGALPLILKPQIGPVVETSGLLMCEATAVVVFGEGLEKKKMKWEYVACKTNLFSIDEEIYSPAILPEK